MPLQNQFIAQRCGDVTFPNAWQARCHDIGGRAKKASRLQALNLKLELGWQALQIKSAEGLVWGKGRSTQESCGTPLHAQLLLVLAQFQQIGFVREALFGGFERQIGKHGSHAAQVQAL